MALIQFLKDELRGNVDILESGAISVQTLFLKRFRELGGDEGYLHSLIEDYICYSEYYGVTFDADKLIEEYERKIKKGENDGKKSKC